MKKLIPKKYVPVPYQKKGIKYVTHQKRFGLLLDPGMGKTSIILSSINDIMDLPEPDCLYGSVLIIAPLSVCFGVWEAERDKWGQFNDLTIEILHSKNKYKSKEKAYDVDSDIYVINPEGLEWLFNQPGVVDKFDMLVIDESTMFKNPSSKRFKLLKKNLYIFTRRYILTGTPIPNGLEDLWSQIFILDEGNSLGKFVGQYRQQYFFPIPMDNQGKAFNLFKLVKGKEEQIYTKIAPITLRLSAKDYMDLPDISFNVVNVKLPLKVRKQYQEIEREYFAILDDKTVSAGNAAVASIKCRQIASGGIYSDPDIFEGDFERKVIQLHDEKTNRLKEMVEDLGGKSVLIAYEFNHDLLRLKKAFPKARIIGSGTSPKDRAEAIKDWNAGFIPVLLGQPSSMGHGLNLQEGGSDIFWYTPTWNLELFEQFNKRLHRKGQEKPVMVHLMVAEDTIDEAVVEALTNKAKDQNNFLDSLQRYRKV